MIDAKDVAWMAGVVDLKGRVIRKKNDQRRTRQTLMYVESKQLEVVAGLCALTGTNAESKKQSTLSEWIRTGCAEHCPTKHIHVDRAAEGWSMPRTSRWTMTGASMVVVLHSLLPYLRVERGYREAMEAILADQDLTGRGAQAMWANVSRLVRLGWPLPPSYVEPMRGWLVKTTPSGVVFEDENDMMVVGS